MGETDKIRPRYDKAGVAWCQEQCPCLHIDSGDTADLLCMASEGCTRVGDICYHAAVEAFRDHRAMEAMREGKITSVERANITRGVEYKALGRHLYSGFYSGAVSDDPADAMLKASARDAAGGSDER